MEEAPAPSEPATRRSKRPRVQTEKGAAQPVDRVRKDRSPNRESEEREGSFDDFEDVPRHKQPKLKPTAVAATTKDNPTLIEVIKGNGKIIPQLVKNWVEHYEKDPKPALAELLTMLFEVCGAKYQIKEELLDETDVDDVVVALVTLAKNGKIEDRQNSKKKEMKNFKDNLTSFWDNLVSECQNGPLFDKILFDKCMDYVIALSCTPPRSYRQVASLMGLQLVTSLITAAKTFGAQRETTQRQLNAERKKRADGPRVESLEKRLSQTHEKITALEEMMRKNFTGLFVHRYRDIDSEIRLSCIQSLGVWILSYQSMFLQDLYLKYLGWTLNDKDAGVRKASILALQNLYEVDDNVPSLGLFTERFSNRMIELADDCDISVAVCAIGLVKQLLRHQLIPDDDLGALYDLLIDDPPEIRRAIGELVYEHLIAQNFQSSQSRTTADDNASSEVHLSRILQILREFSADQILSTYVIDDVWEYMEAMKDWKCIIAMLLDENPLIVLTDEDATNLIRLLSASVKKAVGKKIVPAADNRKPHESKAQKDINDSNRRDITMSMMKRYPLLLRKFLADKTKIAPLVDIIVHMNLELYSLKRQEQSFKSVIQLLKEALFKHGDKEALRCCVTALSFCAGESKGELQEFAQSILKEVENEIVTKLKSAMKEVEDGEDEYSLLVNSKRLYELQLSRSVPIENLFEELAAFLHRFRNLDDEVACFLILNMYLQVAWSLHSIISSETISETSLELCLSKRNALLEHLEYYLETPVGAEGKYGNELICRVCTILGEVWYLFRKSNYASTKLESLGFCPDKSTLQKFWKLCEQKLYISDETEDEDAHKEYVEETNREAVMIAAAKLIVSGAVPKEYLGPEIISHYVMHGTSVAEIVRHLISVLKKKDDDSSNIFPIFLEALKRAHSRHMLAVENGVETLSGKSFQDCKELATKLSGTFVGAARNKHRLDILKMVKDGVDYAFVDAPQRLSFLESSVVQFVSKLSAPDVLEILKDVEKRTENVNTEIDPSGWRPYHTFIDVLREKYAKNEVLKEENEGTTVKRRGRPPRKINLQGKRKLFDESSEEEDSISVSDHEAPDAEEERDDDDAPLIHSIKSASKLRALKVKRDGVEQRKAGNSAETIDKMAASRTQGPSS